MRRSQPPNGRERGLSRLGISPTCTSLPGQEASPPKSGGADRPAGTRPAKKTPDRTGRPAGRIRNFGPAGQWVHIWYLGHGRDLRGTVLNWHCCIRASFGGWRVSGRGQPPPGYQPGRPANPLTPQALLAGRGRAGRAGRQAGRSGLAWLRCRPGRLAGWSGRPAGPVGSNRCGPVSWLGVCAGGGVKPARRPVRRIGQGQPAGRCDIMSRQAGQPVTWM